MNVFRSKFKKKNIALVAGIVLLMFVLLLYLFPWHRPLVLPQSLLQLRLAEEIRGRQAQDLVDALHKKPVTPDETVIGTYFSTDGSARLYLSVYNSQKTAEEQFAAMIDHIRSGGGDFSQIRELHVQNEKVFMCLGLGQAHYFFLHEKELYWLAADLQIAHASMQELVRIVNITK